jgi:hypothetical protein
MRFIRFFSILILRNSSSRAFYAFFISFFAYLAIFSRISSSRAAVRSTFFLAFFSIISRTFSSRAIAYCNFLSAAVRYR